MPGKSDIKTDAKKGELIHIRVGEQLRKDIEELIEKGIFSSQTELAREAIRNLILKYKHHYDSESETESHDYKKPMKHTTTKNQKVPREE